MSIAIVSFEIIEFVWKFNSKPMVLMVLKPLSPKSGAYRPDNATTNLQMLQQTLASPECSIKETAERVRPAGW
jgi:hypothetical protein